MWRPRRCENPWMNLSTLYIFQPTANYASLAYTTVGYDLPDINLARNIIYPTEDWGTKCAAYYCIDTFLSDI